MTFNLIFIKSLTGKTRVRRRWRRQAQQENRIQNRSVARDNGAARG